MRGRILSALLLPALLIGAFAPGVSGQGGGSYTKEQVARGEFLAAIGGCHHCHTPKVFGPKGPEPDMARMLSGAPAGAKVPPVPTGVISPTGWGALTTADLTTWAGPWGISFASNLTPDRTTGMGNWTEASFIRSMRTG